MLENSSLFVCFYYQFSSQLGKFTFIMGATGAILATGFQLSGMSSLSTIIGFGNLMLDEDVISVKVSSVYF